MNIRLCGGTSRAGITFALTVRQREGTTQTDVRQPGFTRQPLQMDVATHHIVAHFLIIIQFLIGVCFRVVTTDVACHTHAERQRCNVLEESVGIVQRKDVALVGCIGRSCIREGTGVFQ